MEKLTTEEIRTIQDLCAKHHLDRYSGKIIAVARRCIRGDPTNEPVTVGSSKILPHFPCFIFRCTLYAVRCTL